MTVEPTAESDGSWRKERYIPVHEAVDRLQPHVDTPIVLPTDRLAGLRNFKGWMADPRYLDWERRDGRRVGTLVLRKNKRILWIHLGYASPDGCGGRDTAVPVLIGRTPALLWTSRGHIWNQLVWPVTSRGWTGRFGLTGTFEGWQLVRLARSMQTDTPEPVVDDPGC